MTSLDEELRHELQQLRIVAVRRLRELLEKECTAAILDVARKMLADLAPPPPAARRAPPIVTDLPFPPQDEPPE